MRNHLWMGLLAASVLLNLIGAFAVYKAVRYRQAVAEYQEWLAAAERKSRQLEGKILADNPYRTENDALKHRAGKGGGPDVIFYGASITRNWDLAASFPGEKFVNRGMGGKILPYLTLHFRENVIDLHPRFVVIKACGINITPELPPEVIQQSFMNLCELAVANGIAPIAATMLPAGKEAESMFPGYSVRQHIRQFNDWVIAYAGKHSFPIVDYYAAMADEEGFLSPALSQDTLHPSAEGYRRMAEAFRSRWQEVGTGRDSGIPKEGDVR